MKNNNPYFKFLFSLFLLLSATICSQTIITGKVTDENGEPFPGVTIQIVGVQYGTITDIDGRFILKVEDTCQISISFVGYQNKLVDFNFDFTNLEISLEPEEMTMNWTPVFNGSIFAGYFGDINKMPWGISLHSYQPHFYDLDFDLKFKTDLKKQYDLDISLLKSNLVNRSNYSLKSGIGLSYKNVIPDDLKTNHMDYKLITVSRLYYYLDLTIAGIYRQNQTTDRKDEVGILTGCQVKIPRTKINVYSGFTYLDSDREFEISASRKISHRIRFLKSIVANVGYINYKEYQELNLNLYYRWFY